MFHIYSSISNFALKRALHFRALCSKSPAFLSSSCAVHFNVVTVPGPFCLQSRQDEMMQSLSQMQTLRHSLSHLAVANLKGIHYDGEIIHHSIFDNHKIAVLRHVEVPAKLPFHNCESHTGSSFQSDNYLI